MITLILLVTVVGGSGYLFVRRAWRRRQGPRERLLKMLTANQAWSKKEALHAIGDFEQLVRHGLFQAHDEHCEYIQLYDELTGTVRSFLEPHVLAKELPDPVQQSFEIKDGLTLYDDAFARYVATCLASHTRKKFYAGQINSLVADQWLIAADLVNPYVPGDTVWKEN